MGVCHGRWSRSLQLVKYVSVKVSSTIKVGPVPARYVRHSQMCPQLDVSDKNVQKTQDMTDKARFVRQKTAGYVRQNIVCVLLAFSLKTQIIPFRVHQAHACTSLFIK